MIARDINAGAGSDKAVGDSPEVSVSTPSLTITPPSLRSSTGTTIVPAEMVTAEDAPADKAGELLIFRPRNRSRPAQSVMSLVTPETGTVVILHGGREFHTTRARAESFFGWAREVAGSGRAALVPLGHKDGVDLFLITGNTPLP